MFQKWRREEGRLHIPLPYVTKGPYKTFGTSLLETVKSDTTTKNLEKVIAKHLPLSAQRE